MSSAAASPDILETIVAATRRAVQHRRSLVAIDELTRKAAEATPRRAAFHAALAATDRLNIIAECKRRSPSRGVLRPAYDPAAIARSYADAGAAALSILTEPTFFDGSLTHLQRVRAATTLPLLRKDFIVEEYQIVEARAAGADAVLLIVAALDDRQLSQLQQSARDQGLATLVEVHDVAELERAVAAGAEIIGVNNRNLRTLEVDTHASEDIAKRLPVNAIAVSESGLRTRADLDALRTMGYRAFLIGERFMTAPDPGEALRALVAGP